MGWHAQSLADADVVSEVPPVFYMLVFEAVGGTWTFPLTAGSAGRPERRRLLCVVPEGRGAAFACPHRGFEAKEHLSAFGKNVITALERLKLMALSSIPRAEFSDAIALRQSQVFC